MVPCVPEVGSRRGPCGGGGLRTRDLVVSKAGRAGPVVRRRAPVSCPLAPPWRACSGACDAPDELGGQCLLKLGILCVAAIFPAGERGDQCSPEDGVGRVAGG